MNTNPPPPLAGEDKTVAILSYLTLFGFIAALVIHSSKKTRLGAFHLRQALGFMLTTMAAGISASVLIMIITVALSFLHFLGVILYPLLWLAFVGTMVTLWIMGFVAAIQGEMKPMPWIGPWYQKWLGNAFD